MGKRCELTISILTLFIAVVPSTYQQASMPQQDVRGLLHLEKSITKAKPMFADMGGCSHLSTMLRAYRGLTRSFQVSLGAPFQGFRKAKMQCPNLRENTEERK